MGAVNVRIPEQLHRQLREMAEEERRSLNNLMLVLFHNAVKERETKKTQPKQ